MVVSLRRELALLEAKYAGFEEGRATPVDLKTLEELRALGYVD